MNLQKGLEYLTTFQCDKPGACGKGAVCNSCWARGWAGSILERQQAQPKDSADDVTVINEDGDIESGPDITGLKRDPGR